jgi:uncharacterized damage-inducible protein DinB
MSGNVPIVEMLESAFRGPAWHGPSLLEALAGVSAELADYRRAGTHSIHELVLHLAAWKRTVARRLGGETFEPEDFPAPRDWTETLHALEDAHRELIAATQGLDDARLNEIAPGRDHTVAFMLQGAVMHDIYHAGQIGLLRKLGV